jgi:hypothetical protein
MVPMEHLSQVASWWPWARLSIRLSVNEDEEGMVKVVYSKGMSLKH